MRDAKVRTFKVPSEDNGGTSAHNGGRSGEPKKGRRQTVTGPGMIVRRGSTDEDDRPTTPWEAESTLHVPSVRLALTPTELRPWSLVGLRYDPGKDTGDVQCLGEVWDIKRPEGVTYVRLLNFSVNLFG